MNGEYEVIIIGGGSAGLTAGLYTSRNRINSLLIERGVFGGLVTSADWLENYPGFPDGIGGFELGELMQKQALKYGLETLMAEVNGIELQEKQKVVNTTEGSVMAQAVIIAGGSERSKLGVPGEEKFTGRGVSYCATCDAAFFDEKTVAVIGGGNAAISEALHLAKFASKVIVVHRRDQLRATRILQERAFSEPKVEFQLSSIVEEVEGKDTVERIQLLQVATGKKSAVEVSGVFISIGQKPNTGYLRGVVPLDANGYIITNDKMETEIPGILAAGDIRSNSIRQVVAAAGDGSTAAIYAGRFLGE